MICKACNGEQTGIIDLNEHDKDGRKVIRVSKDQPNKVEIILDCRHCVADQLWTEHYISYENAKKFCKCFNNGHGKEELK
jgi:hypothetical protein